jgi:hypothetical protein
VAAPGGSDAREPESESREYQIKAALLLNFMRYTTWPEEAFEDGHAPVVLTVVGKDPFGDVLESTFEGEQVSGRRIVVTRVRELPTELRTHVVFCAETSHAARIELVRACRRRPLLVVGEAPGFAEEGASINFYLADKKTRFEVNTDAVAEASLVIAPGMLKHARIVRTPKEEK